MSQPLSPPSEARDAQANDDAGGGCSAPIGASMASACDTTTGFRLPSAETSNGVAQGAAITAPPRRRSALAADAHRRQAAASDRACSASRTSAAIAAPARPRRARSSAQAEVVSETRPIGGRKRNLAAISTAAPAADTKRCRAVPPRQSRTSGAKSRRSGGPAVPSYVDVQARLAAQGCCSRLVPICGAGTFDAASDDGAEAFTPPLERPAESADEAASRSGPMPPNEDAPTAATFWTLVKRHNGAAVQAAVEAGGGVPGVTDAVARECARWRAACTSRRGPGHPFAGLQAADASALCGAGAMTQEGRGAARTPAQPRRAAAAGASELSRRVSRPCMTTALQAAERAHERVVVRPSAIAGLGGFAACDIPAGAVLLEYQGLLVRSVFADALEARYEAEGETHYLFDVDASDYLVDATRCGNKARFINHSCGPNCEVRTVSADGRRRIVLRAMRALRAGEELCYDYRLAADPNKLIRCCCGSARCRIWL